MRLTGIVLLVLAVSADAQTPQHRQIVEDLRLDATAEDFPNIFRHAIGPHGQIAIFVREDQNLRVYDSTGRKLATFGRTGSGPKESRFIASLRWKADTLWMYDRSLKRMTYLTQNGEFLRHELIPPNLNLSGIPDDGRNPVGAFYKFDPQVVTPDGRIVAWTDLGVGRDDKGTVLTKSSLVLADVNGSNRKVIGAQEKAVHVSVFVRDRGDTIRSAGLPFTTFPVVTYATDGTRFGSVTHTLGPRSGTYTVRVMRTTGDTMFIKSFPFTGTMIPKARRDSAIELIGSKSYSSSINARLRALARDSAPFIYSRVVDFALGKDNTTWLSMRSNDTGQEVVALDARGTPLFSLTLPPRTRLIDGSLSKVWAIQTDEDGLPSVVRYRIK